MPGLGYDIGPWGAQVRTWGINQVSTLSRGATAAAAWAGEQLGAAWGKFAPAVGDSVRTFANSMAQYVAPRLEQYMYRTGAVMYAVPSEARIGDVKGAGGTFAKDAPYVIRYDPNVPGRPAPQYSIDSLTFENPRDYNAQGYPRDAGEFWKGWAEKNPDALSSSNRYLIENYDRLKVSPRVDQTWIDVFPEHGNYMGDVLIHHHVDFGRFTIPVPGQTHVGSGGLWHL